VGTHVGVRSRRTVASGATGRRITAIFALLFELLVCVALVVFAATCYVVHEGAHHEVIAEELGLRQTEVAELEKAALEFLIDHTKSELKWMGAGDPRRKHKQVHAIRVIRLRGRLALR